MRVVVSCLAVMVALLVAAAGTSSALGSTSAGPKILWTVETPEQTQFGYPTIYENILACGSENVGGSGTQNNVWVIDRFTGKPLWNKTQIGHGLYTAAGEGILFMGGEFDLNAYDIKTGHTLWSVKAPSKRNKNIKPWPGKPTYDDGKVYVTWYNSPMLVLHASNGSKVYETDYTVGSRIFVQHVGGRKTLQFMTIGSDGMHAATSVNPDNGHLFWSVDQYPQGDSSFATLLINDYGLVTKTWPQNTTTKTVLTGYDRSQGEKLWSFEGTSANSNNSFDYNILVNRAYGTYQNTSDSYTVFSRDIRTGELSWQKTVPTTDDSINLAAFDRTVLLVGYYSAKTWAFDAYTGDHLWTLDQTFPWYGYATENVYYFGGGNNKLMAVQLHDPSTV